ncbi:MAG: hypothetical protein U0792_13315 [Gemmataceae bacterium]
MARPVTALVLGLAIAGCSRTEPTTIPKPSNPLLPNNPDTREITTPKTKTLEIDPATVEAQEKAIKFVEGYKGKVKRAGKAVVEVDLSFNPVTDAELKELAGLKHLHTLNLSYTQVTDVGLQELTALKNLTTLSLRGTKVTGITMRDLLPLKNLASLDLRVTQVRDPGLKELAALKSLTSLDIFAIMSSDEAVQDLQRALPKCKIISISLQ